MSNVTNTGTGCDLSDLINSVNRGKSSVFTVTTLWIILFGLIVTQKVFKYVIKPRRNNNGNNGNNGNNEGGGNNRNNGAGGGNNNNNNNGGNDRDDCTII